MLNNSFIFFTRSDEMYNTRTHQRSKDILDIPIDSFPTFHLITEDHFVIKCKNGYNAKISYDKISLTFWYLYLKMISN